MKASDSVMASKNSGGLLKRLIYYAILLSLAVGVIKVYLLWLDGYVTLRPEVVAAVPMGYVEELPLDGVLIWDEQLITATRDGVLTYPSPLPRRVMKDEAVAALDGVAVRVGVAGYFIPALDGEEEEWVYSRLWPGISAFPPLRPLNILDNGARMRRGDPVGKLVPQPQDLRCIAYLDKTVSLMQDIKNGFVEIRMNPDDKTQRADVRAYWDTGQKIKVYLTLPFFPASMISTRGFACSVLTGNRRGVAVPDSAVILRGGKTGVLKVLGGMTEFTEVEGFPTEGDNFFITRGILSGNVVVLHADRIKEGVVRLW
ncbi:MAG: hypothetical protein FWG71_02330 [Synergistaceae bacterium]|nr:hypothetical protein [Synergistaceae bacterium]